MPNLETSPQRELSRESRWFTAGFAVLGCITMLMNASGGSLLAGGVGALGWAVLAWVGYRYPIAYDRPLKDTWSTYRAMDRRTVAFAIASIAVIVTSFWAQITHAF